MGSRKRVHLIALLSLAVALGMAVFPGPTLGAGRSTTPRPVPLVDPFVTPTGVYFDHVVIIMMENEGVYDICHGSPPPCNGIPSNATYLAGLANNYTIGSQYLALVTTSQPNYVAMISGSMQGCTSAGCPSPITAPNLVDRFEAAGLTWKAYQENMTGATPGSCNAALNDGEPYTSIHNPFIVFQDITNNTSRCNKIVNANPNTCGLSIDCTLVNDLNNSTSAAPNFMFLTPNDCNDMRGWTGCGTSQLIGPGNYYLSKLVPLILNSKTFTTTRSALLITFDEGNKFCPGPFDPNEDCVFASWSGPVAKTHFSTGNLYSHYSVTKTIETNWNLTGFTLNDANANSMAEFFKSQPANYNLYASPETMITPQGVSANSTITVTSYNNFTGTVNLSATSSPSGPSLTLNPTSVTLTKQGSAASKLSLQTSTVGNYTITLRATSGSLTHTNTILVQVVPPDFSISANPSTLTIGQASIALGSTVNATVTGDRTAFESSYLRYSFYANGRIWLFYEDSRFQCEHETGCLSYTSSTNGTSWANPTRTTVHITDNDFSVYTNGTSIFYVRYNETSADNTCGKKMMFGLGTLATTGTVTWQPEQIISNGAANRAYPEDEIIVDNNNQVWIAYMMDYKTSCGNAVSSQRPWVLHSAGTNYASWIGNTTLCTASCSSRIYHIDLASLGNGQVYGLYWTSRSGTGLHGRIFNGTGTSGWANEETISIDSADVNAWLFNNGSNLYAIYFDNNTETFNFASRSAKGSWTISTISIGETHTGTNFLPSYYALPDTASYDAADNLFTLFYLNGTSQRIDQWTGSGTVWTKNTGIITTPPASYPDSMFSFIQSTPSFVGQLYYITGTTRFTINSVRLSFAHASNLASFTTTITAGLGFSATVTLSSAISPTSGLAATCTPSTIPGGSGTSTCNLTASISGNYNVTVTGTSGSLVHSAIVTVRVLTFPDFTITVSTPAPVDVGQSSSTTMTLSAISGFSGTVTLSDSVPSGLSCTPVNPASVSLPPNSTATLSCTATTANNYNVTMTGTNGTLSHSTIVTFKFQDFTITASTPAPGNVGTSQASTISINGLNGFSGTVSITDTVPNGLSCGPITPTTVSGSGTATVSCNSGLAGTYTLAITGASNPLSHSTNVTFTFQDFTIIASSPNPVDANQQANSTIRINSLDGFSGSVNLTETIPSGLSCSTITPSAVTGSGNATVSCNATLAGNYTLTVFGTSGSLQHNATVLLQFQDFTVIATAPAPVEIRGTANSTATIAAVNQFSGTVSLSITLPPGLNCGPVLPGSLSGSGHATVTCSSSTSGNYTVTVTGVSGPLVHTATFLVRITDFSLNAATVQIVSPVGSNATLTLNLSSLNGYQGNLTLSGSPAAYAVIIGPGGGGAGGARGSLRLAPPPIYPVVVFSPTSILLNGSASSTLTFILGPVQAGNYTITVTATDGPVSHQIRFTIIATDYQITNMVGSLTMTQGTNSTLTIGLQSLNGFQGNLTISTTVNPAGPIATLSRSILFISGNGNTTLLTISIPSSTTPGNYTVTITAAVGSIVHTFTMNLSVSSPGFATILAGAISSNKILALGLVGTFSLMLILPARRMQQNSRRHVRTTRLYSVIDHRPSRTSPSRFSAIQPIYGACLKDEYD